MKPYPALCLANHPKSPRAQKSCGDYRLQWWVFASLAAQNGQVVMRAARSTVTRRRVTCEGGRGPEERDNRNCYEIPNQLLNDLFAPPLLVLEQSWHLSQGYTAPLIERQ